MRDGLPVKLYEGGVDLEVVGESYHQDELRALAPNTRDRIRVQQHAILVPESGNPYDSLRSPFWSVGWSLAIWVVGMLPNCGQGSPAWSNRLDRR
jgi:hypothetical protein